MQQSWGKCGFKFTLTRREKKGYLLGVGVESKIQHRSQHVYGTVRPAHPQRRMKVREEWEEKTDSEQPSIYKGPLKAQLGNLDLIKC